MIYYPTHVAELLHIRREFEKGNPIIIVFEHEAQNYKYGKKAYCNIIKKQIDNVFEFTEMIIAENGNLLHYDEEIDRGTEIKVTEIEKTRNFEYYYFNHKNEVKILNELLEYLQKNTIENEQSTNNTQTLNSTFTALQWSTIFYYVEPDLYGEIKLKKDKLIKFIKDFNVKISRNGLAVKISHNNLSNKHSEIVRITNGDKKNELKQKHIDAIKKILPYLKTKYIEAFENASDDLSILIDDLDRK